jgi:dihydrofolate reductase
MGRVTYQEMASFWPTATGDYAAPMNEIPKVVFSKTIEDAPWPQSTIAAGDISAEVAALKEQPGGELIAWGGAGFAQAMTRAALVDEYAIVVQPVVYGAGKAIFGELPDALHLELAASTTYASGTMLNVYRPLGWGQQVQR